MKKKRGWPKGKKRGLRKTWPIKITDLTNGTIHNSVVTPSVEGIKIEEIPIEQIPEKDAKDDIKYRSDKIKETVFTRGWQEYILPRIKACIEIYEVTYDDVDSLEELKVNQVVRKELKAILADIERWVKERKELLEEEEKE